jgi:hypothetical protein
MGSVSPSSFENLFTVTNVGTNQARRHGYTYDTELILPILRFNSIPEISPSDILPKNVWYKERGLIYLRSGWEEQDLQFSFECRRPFTSNGTNFHWRHDQGDKNHFTLNVYGENFAIDPGYAVESDWLWATKFHNSITIGPDPILPAKPVNGQAHHYHWTSEGAIKTLFEGDFGIFLSGDATNAYNELFEEINDPEGQYYRIRSDPPQPGFVNTVQKAERFIQCIRASSDLPLYFILTDDIQKDEEIHVYKYRHQTLGGEFNLTINTDLKKRLNRISNPPDPQKYLDLNIIYPPGTSTYSELQTMLRIR